MVRGKKKKNSSVNPRGLGGLSTFSISTGERVLGVKQLGIIFSKNRLFDTNDMLEQCYSFSELPHFRIAKRKLMLQIKLARMIVG